MIVTRVSFTADRVERDAGGGAAVKTGLTLDRFGGKLYVPNRGFLANPYNQLMLLFDDHPQ
jgi:hypothetical protein